MSISAEDKILLHEALSRLYLALDNHDAEGFAARFVADGVFKASYGEFQGPEAIAEFVKNHIASGAEDNARHCLSNFLVDEEPGGALLRCYLVKYRYSTSEVSPVGTSVVTCHMVRSDGEWWLKSFDLKRALTTPP